MRNTHNSRNRAEHSCEASGYLCRPCRPAAASARQMDCCRQHTDGRHMDSGKIPQCLFTYPPSHTSAQLRPSSSPPSSTHMRCSASPYSRSCRRSHSTRHASIDPPHASACNKRRSQVAVGAAACNHASAEPKQAGSSSGMRSTVAAAVMPSVALTPSLLAGVVMRA